jgi:hypothetical protein
MVAVPHRQTGIKILLTGFVSSRQADAATSWPSAFTT